MNDRKDGAVSTKQDLSSAAAPAFSHGGRVIKRSVRVSGHPTSVSLEDAFWAALQHIATQQGCALSELITRIDSLRTPQTGGNLSSLLRVYVLNWFWTPEGPAAGTASLAESSAPSEA